MPHEGDGPDFDRIKREAGTATRDTMALTWLELQEEKVRREQADQALAQPLTNWVTLAGVFGGE